MKKKRSEVKLKPVNVEAFNMSDVKCANKKCTAKWKGWGKDKFRYCSTRCHNDCERKKIISLDF